MVSGPFVALGLGRFVRGSQVIALEPIQGAERGPGRRTLVWVEGLREPLVAARSESAILADLDQSAPVETAKGRGGGGGRRSRGEEPPSLF